MTKTHDLVVVTWNTHAGAQLRSGGLGWIIEELDPDIILLQEVRKFSVIRRWAKRNGWYASSRDQAGTVVLARKARFKLVAKLDRRVSAGPLNRGMQPERRLTALSLVDRITGRTVHANSLHTWAMGKGLARANLRVRRQHVKQLKASALWAHSKLSTDVVIVGGDMNQNLVSKLPRAVRRLSAHRLLGVAGLKATYKTLGQKPPPTSLHGKSVLDEVFVRKAAHTHVLSRTTRTVPRKGGDHRAVCVVLRIDKS